MFAAVARMPGRPGRGHDGRCGAAVSPRQMPSSTGRRGLAFTAITAITKAAIGSARDHPNRVFSSTPTSSTADEYVHGRVCLESATAEAVRVRVRRDAAQPTAPAC